MVRALTEAAAGAPGQPLRDTLRKEEIVALYEELFDQKLKAKEFLADKDQAKVVRERLRRADEEFDRHNANVFAINMCLHAASSIILSRPCLLYTSPSPETRH